MVVGFCYEFGAPGAPADADVLGEIRCERIFRSDVSSTVTKETIEFLRHGDVLVVAEVARLAPTIEDLLLLVERLHRDHIGVHCIRDGIVPGLPTGESFGEVCATLARFCREAAQARLAAQKRGRGRPTALSPEDRERAARLLKRATVIEVASLLRVSPATIYRYFPRGKLGPKPADPDRSREPDQTEPS